MIEYQPLPEGQHLAPGILEATKSVVVVAMRRVHEDGTVLPGLPSEKRVYLKNKTGDRLYYLNDIFDFRPLGLPVEFYDEGGLTVGGIQLDAQGRRQDRLESALLPRKAELVTEENVFSHFYRPSSANPVNLLARELADAEVITAEEYKAASK